MAPERGVALITVLFILALMATAAAYSVEGEYLALRRTQNLLESEQAFQMAIGSERWVMRILARDRRDGKTDHLNESWARLGPAVQLDEGSMASTVVDQQGLFNINNLAGGKDKLWYPVFRRLLAFLELDGGIADAVVDWLDKDQAVTGSRGAEDTHYLLKDPPYRNAGRPIVELGELLWVEGIDRATLAVLVPYLTAIPGTGIKVNVNTSPAVLLRMLTPTVLGESAAQALIDGRGEQGYGDVESFLAMAELAGLGDALEPLVTVRSDHFLIHSRSQYGRVRYLLETLVQRDDRRVSVLARRRTLQ